MGFLGMITGGRPARYVYSFEQWRDQLGSRADPHTVLMHVFLDFDVNLRPHRDDDEVQLFARATTAQFACLPFPDCATALAHYVSWKLSPADFAKHPDDERAFTKLMAPVSKARNNGTFVQLYCRMNPLMGRAGLDGMNIPETVTHHKREPADAPTKRETLPQQPSPAIGSEHGYQDQETSMTKRANVSADEERAIYQHIADEIGSNRTDRALIAQATAQAMGVESKIKAFYIQLRYGRLADELATRKAALIEAARLEAVRLDQVKISENRNLIASSEHARFIVLANGGLRRLREKSSEQVARDLGALAFVLPPLEALAVTGLLQHALAPQWESVVAVVAIGSYFLFLWLHLDMRIRERNRVRQARQGAIDFLQDAQDQLKTYAQAGSSEARAILEDPMFVACQSLAPRPR